MSSLGDIARRFNCSLIGDEKVVPQGVAINSSQLEKDFLFVAAPGAKTHGISFISDAINRGAIALLTDISGDYPIPTLIHPHPREIAGEVAKMVFETPSTGLFAVTGTNGKTSTVFYLQRLLNQLGKPAGLLSSAEQIVGNHIQQADLTTPEAPRIHQLLAQMRRDSQVFAAVEVSAQALIRNRVEGLFFDVAGFTNLSRDHLDDFGTMENYLQAKAQLFTTELTSKAVINVEDRWGKLLYEKIAVSKVGIGEGYDYQASYLAGRLRLSGKASLEVDFAGGQLMAKNFALALVMLLEAGHSVDQIASAASGIDAQIPGRLQLVSDRKPHIFVDYAHTPAGVEAAVREIASRYPEITVLIAASGNRDVGKREDMALACRGAHRIIVTDQHPRDEDPAAIRSQLLKAAQQLDIEIEEVADPAAAISRAVEITAQDCAILWCGPGQLPYREIRGEKIPFSALEIARRAVEGD